MFLLRKECFALGIIENSALWKEFKQQDSQTITILTPILWHPLGVLQFNSDTNINTQI